MEKQGIIIQVLDAHKTLRFFEEYREVPIEHHWRGSPLRGRRTLAETGRGTYAPGQSRVPSLVTLTSNGQPCPTSSGDDRAILSTLFVSLGPRHSDHSDGLRRVFPRPATRA